MLKFTYHCVKLEFYAVFKEVFMANKNDYFSSRNEISNDKIDALLADLPYFAADFFYGIANNTSALTRLNYAYDLEFSSDTFLK